MDAKQLEEYDQESTEEAQKRRYLFLRKYEKTKEIDLEVLLGSAQVANSYLWNQLYIPSKIFLVFNRPAIVNFDPVKNESFFFDHYQFGVKEMEDLIERGYIIPMIDSYQSFAHLDYLDGLLEKAKEYGIHREIFWALGEIQYPFWQRTWGEKYDQILDNAESFGGFRDHDISSEGQKFVDESLSSNYSIFALNGYTDLADAFMGLFKRRLISPKTFHNIASTGRYTCNELFGRAVLSYSQIEEFLKWKKAVGPLVGPKNPPGHDLSSVPDVFSFEFTHTLLDLGGHDKDVPLLLNPSIGWDDYLDLLGSIEKELKEINDNKYKLLKKENFKESIDDFLNTEKDMVKRFQSIIDSCDKSYKSTKEWTAFGGYTTASVLTGNPIPFLTGLAYELTKKTPFFEMLGKAVNATVPQIAGKVITGKIEGKLTRLYDKLCRYPWAALYFEIKQRDLPKHMRIAMRNYWVLKQKRVN